MKFPFAVRLAPLALLWLLSPSLIYAQTVARPSTGVSSAEAAWQSLTTLRTAATASVTTDAVTGIAPATPVPATPVPATSATSAVTVATPAAVKAAVQLAADRSRQLATAAKNF